MSRHSFACYRRGDVIDRVRCRTCGGGVYTLVYSCELHGRATLARQGGKRDGIMPCGACPDRDPYRPLERENHAKMLADLAQAVPRVRGVTVVPFDYEALPGRNRYNASVARHAGRLVLCYRDGYSYGSDLRLCSLHDDLTPREDTHWELGRRWPEYASYEDPRLFSYDGALWLSYGMYRYDAGTSCVIARCRLSGDCSRALPESHVKMEARQRREKNWIFFECEGELYCEYRLWAGTHVVYHVAGDTLEAPSSTSYADRWRYGLARGGTNVTLVDGRLVGFFHSRRDNRYFVGAYEFEASPPFRMTRMSVEPLLSSPPPARRQRYTAVFPCGAILEEGRWLVSHGSEDRWHGRVEFFSVRHEDVLRSMLPV